jgi:DNA-directed RNA polymerase subunit RPC12/RpoP
MINQTISQLAKEGKPEAIASLINERLTPKGITANVDRQDNCLQIVLESERLIDQKVMVPFIEKGITALSIQPITEISICAKRVGGDVPYWHQRVKLFPDQAKWQPSSPQEQTIESDVNTLESQAKIEQQDQKLELQINTIASQANERALQNDESASPNSMIESQNRTVLQNNRIESQDNMIELQSNTIELQSNTIELQDDEIEIAQPELVQKFTIPKIEEPNRIVSIVLGTLGILVSLFLLGPILARVLGILGIIASFGFLINGFSEAMFLKGECPYCGTATSVMSNQLGTDCKACKQRILVKKNRFYRVD